MNYSSSTVSTNVFLLQITKSRILMILKFFKLTNFVVFISQGDAIYNEYSFLEI